MSNREKLFKELEAMETDADFVDHFNKMVEIIKISEDTDRVLLLYKLLSNVRNIGYNDGKKAEKEAIQQYLSKR